MLIKDDLYEFEIWYINHEKAEKMILYSDSNDINTLESVPQTAYCILANHKDIKENPTLWHTIGYYRIGDKITLDEAKKELEALEKLEVDEGETEYSYKIRALYSLKAFCRNEKNNTRDADVENIFINKNIDLDCVAAINARISIIPSDSDFKTISPSQIVNGRIVPTEHINSKNEVKKIDAGDLYLDLE